MSMARQGLFQKMLFATKGDAELTKLTTPERAWPSQYFHKEISFDIGRSVVTPMAAPNPRSPVRC